MTTTGTEKYSRIVLSLMKVGTKLTRRLLEERVKELTPPGTQPNINAFLRNNRDRILQKRTGKNKELIYFPSNGTTDLEQWDLLMFCFILLEICGLAPTLRMYVTKLQKIRNKMCHMKEPELADDKYADFTDKLNNCFTHCCTEINDLKFTTDIQTLHESCKSDPLSLHDAYLQHHLLYHMEYEVKQILEKQSEEHKGMDEKIDKVLDKLERIDSRLPGGTVKVPGIGIVIEVKNCDEDKEKEAVDVLIKIFNEIINRQESNDEEEISNSALHTVREAVKETFKEFIRKGRHIVKVEQKCVMLTINCDSVRSFVSLLRDYRSDNLKQQLHDLVLALRLYVDIEDVYIETVIYKDDFWNVTEILVATLDEQVQPKAYALQPFLSHSGIPSTSAGCTSPRLNGVGDVHFSSTDVQAATSVPKNSVRITIHTATLSQQQQIENYLETPGFGQGIRRIQSEIGRQLNVTDISLTAQMVKEADSKNDVSQTREDKQMQADSGAVSISVASGEGQHHLVGGGATNCGQGPEAHEEQIDIDSLIDESYEAWSNNDNEFAIKLALKAKGCTDMEKDKLLSVSKSGAADEQVVADWYRECSNILFEMKDYIRATECYYSAMVFDPSWDYEDHLFMSDMLWGKLVFFGWNYEVLERNEFKDVEKLLVNLDELAQLAEKRKKWSICVAIDGDIDTIYYFLNILRCLRMIPSDMEKPGRKAALWRQARCYLHMGLHNDVRKTCLKILQEACDYDDAEAFEIWARSLYKSKDYIVAFEKCQLAIKNCKKETEKDRLVTLMLEIETKMKEKMIPKTKEPDEEWLKGTNVKLSTPKVPTTSEKKKKKHKRPKARFHSEQSVSSKEEIANQSFETVARVLGRSKGATSSLKKQKHVDISIKTSMTSHQVQPNQKTSKLSDSTESERESETDIGITEIQHKAEECDGNITANTELFADESDLSFYEQSLEKKQNKTLYQILLESGITLDNSYVNKFDDKRKSVLEREEFYSEFLTKSDQQSRISQCPKQYVKCKIQFETSHEAFCIPVEPNRIRTIQISGRSKIGQVFNEDEVTVELLDRKEESEKRYGKVVGVFNRKRHANTKHPVFLCTLDDKESHLVRPMCTTVPKIHVLNREISKTFKTKKEQQFKIEVYNYDASAGCFKDPQVKAINPGDEGSYIFLVAYIHWGRRHIYPRGVVLKILPKVNSVSAGLQLLTLQFNVSNLYKKETVEEVRDVISTADDNIQSHMNGRENLIDQNIFTIDEDDVKDLNYAFSIIEFKDGYKIGVHVTDVSALVQKDSLVDIEAMDRGVTFKPDIGRVRHLFPEPLSEGICSLTPNEVRLTLSVFFCVSENGSLMQTRESTFEIKKSYIKSKRHLTFQEASKLVSPSNSDASDKVEEDVKMLMSISAKMRRKRLLGASTAVDIDFEVLDCAGSNYEFRRVQSMIDEILIMVNKKVTYKLLRNQKIQHIIPLLHTPQPSPEAVEDFLKSNQYIDILLKFQNKRIGSKQPNYNECPKSKTANVMLSKSVWESMSDSPKQAAKYIEKDDIHPYQFIAYMFWLSVQRDAEYKCAAYLKNEKNSEFYAKFTSPLRSYIDLVMHRLIHAAVIENVKCPYEMNDVEQICVHQNTVRRRAREFHQSCRQLDLAVRLRDKPVMVCGFVSKISDKSITLCSPLFKTKAKKEYELSFNLLDLAERPVVRTNNQQEEFVNITWKKRLYDVHVQTLEYNESKNGTKLNPHTDAVFLPLSEWATMLKYTVEQSPDRLSRAISCANVSTPDTGLDDVIPECLKSLDLRPYTQFSMTFSRGQLVKVQFSAASVRGMLTPKPMLYNMTRNVKFCLKHTEDPVLCLCRYATLTTSEKYKNIQEYLKRWLPINEMESATGAVRNEESFIINNVPVEISELGEGKFSLGLPECEVRNIQFSGTTEDDGDDVNEGKDDSYDWLCLKTELQNTEESNIPSFLCKPVWIGHASITKVTSKKTKQHSGKVTVHFKLQNSRQNIPQHIMKHEVNFSVEVLRKLEVDRRAESYIKMLPKLKDSLAADIALNNPIQNFDKNRKEIALSIDHDLYYDTSNEDLRRKPLPMNNSKQQEAIDKALISRFSLIQGPPGTGKTNTGIKLIYLFNKINEIMHKEGKPKKQVLFCGPSNKSVDLVAIWMLNRMGNFRPNFVRVYGRSIETIDFPVPGRTFQSKRSTRSQRADPRLFPVALHHLIRQKGKKNADEIIKLDKKFKENKYAPMPLDVKKYVHLVREASIDEIRCHDVILCTTAVGTNPKVLQAASVYQVIVDEAGMCPEPQCLVPIIATKAEQVVLIGDHHQLRPIIMCKEAASLGLDTSLFERYAVTKLSKNVRFTMLEEQYRMHPSICSFPSKQFYKNRLKTEKGYWYNNNLDIWPKKGTESYHHILIDVEGEEETLTVSTEDGNEQSKSNIAEADHVIKVHNYLFEKLRAIPHKDTIQILSQYNAQCSEIKRKLRGKGFDGENVSTVVSSQGGEWDYVIFSTVRSLPDYKIEENPTIGWCQHNLGFITDKNQINVAITRARKGIIIIGNKHLLECDKVWKELIKCYGKEGCVMTKEQFPPKQQTGHSAQENTYHNQRTSYIGASMKGTRRRRRQAHVI